MDDYEYFGFNNAFGSTDLNKALKSPAHVKVKIEQTPQMALGSLLHTKVLRPHLFKGVVFEGDKRTKEGKSLYDSLLADGAKSSDIIKFTEMEKLNAMHESIIKTTGNLFESPTIVKETAGIFTEDNVHLRIKPDARCTSGFYIIDLKKTQDLSGDSFSRSCMTYGYYLQAAFYLDTASKIDGKEYTEFLIVAVEESAPYGCRMFQMDVSAINYGRHMYKKALQIIKECVKNNDWPCYSKEIEFLSTPSWIKDV
jgi:hypothetical protein